MRLVIFAVGTCGSEFFFFCEIDHFSVGTYEIG